MRYLLCLLILTGCSEQPSEVSGKDSIDVSNSAYGATIRMVTTTDGTRCAVMYGANRGGITCDWASNPSKEAMK